MVPHLVTALNGPLLDLEKRILAATPAIERWFRLEWQEHTPPFYCSVDLRNAGFKLAPVDTNLFPGGFNNLSPEMLPLAVQAAMAAIEKYCPDAKNLLLIPERHTRNTFYLQNIARLTQIFRQTGLNVRLGTCRKSKGADQYRAPRRHHADARAAGAAKQRPSPWAEEFRPVHHPAQQRFVLGDSVRSSRICRSKICCRRCTPVGRYAARATTSPRMTKWSKKFAKLIDVDGWMLNPYFARCGQINFQERTGEECLASNVDTVLAKIRKKYKEYGIKEKPFVIVKADAGTYGMGIMTVKDASEVRDLNRKQRNKMSVVKEGLEVSDVIIQEGVYTFEHINDAVAEPVVYMIDRYVVGGFYRVHAERGIDENLNSPGMHFVPLAFAEQHALPDMGAKPGTAPPNRFYMYGVVARMALLAASLELEKTDPNPEVY